jgi:hypothetical protein
LEGWESSIATQSELTYRDTVSEICMAAKLLLKSCVARMEKANLKFEDNGNLEDLKLDLPHGAENVRRYVPGSRSFMQQFLNFLPLPHGQESFRPIRCLPSGLRVEVRRANGVRGAVVTLGRSSAFWPPSFSRA